MLSEEERKAIKYLSQFEGNYVKTVLNLITKLQKENKEKDKEIEHQIEKRDNQKAELAILNEKQKEMNKLINIVKSDRGQIKKLEHTNKSYKGMIKKKDKQINYMANFINDNMPYTKDLKELENEEGIRTASFTIKYFERKIRE